MLTLQLPKSSFYDDEKEEFVDVPAMTLELEHSLISISKWESKWEKPFLGKGEKAREEVLDYIACMAINRNFRNEFLLALSQEDFDAITEYISRPMTATKFYEAPGAPASREVVTSEIIYYWMVTFNIPFECEKWHLQRLLTLIKVCSIKNGPQKKMPASEIAQSNRELNRARLKATGTRG